MICRSRSQAGTVATRMAPILTTCLIVAGCGGGITSIERESVRYNPPAGSTRGISVVSVSADPENVNQVIENSLTLAGFDVQDRPESDLIVATFQGPPERYLDCGTVGIGSSTDEPAAQRILTVGAKEPSDVQLERTLDLYARTTIELEGTSYQTTIDPDVDYVVVKNVDAFDGNGRIVSRNPEVISFSSGESGTFSIGTTCKSNGRLEESIGETVTAAFQAPSAPAGTSLASTRSPLTTPDTCGSAGRAAYCDLVDFVMARHWRDDVGVSLLGGSQIIEEGQQVVLDIETPPDLPVIAVSYVDVQGQVVNLKPVRLQGGLRRSAFVTRAEVAPPFGEEMVLVYATQTEDLVTDRPFTEDLTSFADYLDTLNSFAGDDIALNFVTLTTEPGS